MPLFKPFATATNTLRARLNPSLRTRGGGGGGPSRWTSPGHEERPKGFAFNRTPPPPGESRKWEDWELPCYLTSFLTIVASYPSCYTAVARILQLLLQIMAENSNSTLYIGNLDERVSDMVLIFAGFKEAKACFLQKRKKLNCPWKSLKWLEAFASKEL